MRRSSQAILGIVGLMTGLGIYWFMSPSAVLERRWSENDATIRGRKFSVALLTKRHKTGDRTGQSSPYDTLEYEFTAKPTTSLAADALQEFTQAPLEVWFLNDKSEPVIEPLSLSFEVGVSSNHPVLLSKGKLTYDSGIARAKRFVLQERPSVNQ